MSIFDDVKQVDNHSIATKYLGHPHKICGSRYWYLSPFRKETKPSFLAHNKFHDFGENWHGDSIDLVSRIYGLSQIDACKLIAEDFNIPINEYESDYIVALRVKEQREKQKAIELLELWFNEIFIKLCDKYQENRELSKYLRNFPCTVSVLANNSLMVEHIIDEFIKAKTTDDKLNLYKYKGVIEQWI